jgi:anaerobic selenocysteine-containing dehydrogenase
MNTETPVKNNEEIWEDTWIPTQCHRCQSECAIKVHKVNGVAVKIEGNPDSPIGSRGGVCPKGIAGLQLLYDPNRLKYPLRERTRKKASAWIQNGSASAGRRLMGRLSRS